MRFIEHAHGICPATLCREPIHGGKRPWGSSSSGADQSHQIILRVPRAFDAWPRIAIWLPFTEAAVQVEDCLTD